MSHPLPTLYVGLINEKEVKLVFVLLLENFPFIQSITFVPLDFYPQLA